MRKFTLILASLFLGIGMAVAQTRTGIFAGCEVTFTNIQKDGTTKFTLYINDSNELALSTSSAEELGGAAKFFCEKKGDNAYSFYNREKELYLIWRGKGYGYNSDKGVLAEYSSDYCNWSITQGQVIGETQTYYFGGKRNDKSAGTLVVMKTTGVFDAWNNTQAYNDNYTNLYDINIVNREYVADPAGFENGKIYTFVTERGWMGAKDDNNNVISTAKTSHNLTGNKEETNFQWTVYKSKNGNYYLYNIGKEMFMGVQASNNASVPFVASPAGKKLTFKVSSNLQYPLMFSTDNAAVVNHSDRYGDGCISWTGGWGTLNDTGSNHKVEVVGDASADVLAKIEKLVAVREIGYFRLKGHSGNYIDASSIHSNATATVGQMSMKSDANCNLAGTIFYYDDDNKFKNYATGTHIRVTREIGSTKDNDGNTWQVYISGAEGKFKLLSNANNWLHDNNGNRADRCSAEGDHANTTHSWTLEMVAEEDLPGVAKIGDTQYPTLAAAIAAAQSGQTIQLQRSTNEDCILPAGVSFKKNGSTILAPNVKVAVAAVDGTSYATLAEAVAAVQAGQTLVLWADTDETIELPEGVILNKNGFTAPNVTVAKPAAAKIDDIKYETFDKAYTAAKNGDVIELFETAVISKTMANYNKKTITVKADGLETAFLVKSSVVMGTFAGMTIETDGTCLTFGTTAGDYNPTVDINGGTYKGGTSAITVVSGLVRIADGVFSATDSENTIVGDVKNINVNGGKFYNFNPTSYIPNNRIAQKGTDGYYAVTEAAAKIGDVKYADLASAINAAQDGETVTLLRNINLGDITSAVIVKKSITIDGEGYWTITINSVNDTYNKGAFAPRGPISYTFKNLTVDLKNAASDMAAFNMKYGGTLENVTVKGAFGQAVSVTMAYPVTVTNCAFDGAAWGVYASSSNVKVNVTGTTFNTTGAVYLHQYGELVFTDNIVAADSYIETDATVDVSKNFWNGNNATGNAPTAAQLKGDNIICDTYYASNNNGVLGDLTENGVAETPVIKIELDGKAYEYGPSKLSLIGKLLGSSTQADAVKITLLDNVTLENGLQIAAYIEDGTLAITPKSVEIDLGGKTLTGFIQINANVTATIKNGTVTATNNTYPGVDVVGKVTLDKVTINAANDVRVSSEAELIASAKIGNTYYATLENAMAAEGDGDVELLVEKSIVLNDGEAYTYGKTLFGEGVNVEYTRTLIAGIWNPIYLPFEAGLNINEFEVAEFTSAKGTTVTLTKLPADNEGGDLTLKPNTAYVVRPVDGNELRLGACGSIYSNKVEPQPLGENGFFIRGNYSVLKGENLGANDRIVSKDGQWAPLAGTSYLKPFRLILTIPAGVDASAISMRVEDEDTTSIETLETMTEVTIYDLMGRRVETMTEGGIYIVNGKKVVIK